MNHHTLIKVGAQFEKWQEDALDKLKKLNPRVSKDEHRRRALDMYLSLPTIQQELGAVPPAPRC